MSPRRAQLASTPGRIATCHGGASRPAGTGLPAYKRLQVVLDEKSPTYAPPTFVRVTPAELVAVGDEWHPELFSDRLDANTHGATRERVLDDFSSKRLRIRAPAPAAPRSETAR
ncbi:MAG: hypothetical protein ABIQ16_02640 [Polyangiaceae bacterium]